MKEYTEEEKDKIGKAIADILMLRKDKDHKDRYQTTWGNKTAIGIFNTVLRIAEDIQAGKPFPG